MLSAVLVAVFSSVALLTALPRKYYSESKLLVKIGRESVGLDPTATTSQTMTIQKTQQAEINSAVEILSSRKLKESIVNELGIEAIFSGNIEQSGGKQPLSSKLMNTVGPALKGASDFLYDIGVRDKVSDFERALIKLDEWVNISAPKNSRVITVSAEAKGPKVAQAIVQLLTDEYLKEHIKISQTPGSFEFFEHQTESAKKALDKAKWEMTEFKAENKILSVDFNQAVLQNAWTGILSNIQDLESEERRLAARYSESHPRLTQVAEQLAVARDLLRTAKNESGSENFSVSVANYLEKIDPGEQSEVKLESTLSALGKIDELIIANSQLELLQEKIESLEDQLVLHRQKFEEARVIKMQQKESISNISVFQPATFNEKPISPNKAVVCAASLMGCSFLALVSSLWKEERHGKSVLRQAREVEQRMKLPIVATIPFTRRANSKCKNGDSLRALREGCVDLAHCFLHPRTAASTADKRPAVVIGVISAESGVGGTTVASALAVCCSKDFGLKTLLVDTDVKSKAIAQRFSLNGAPGLAELLDDAAELDSCIQFFEPFDLSLVNATNSPPAKSEKISLKAGEIARRVESLRDRFEVIIVDLPPALEANHSLSVAVTLDHAVLVTESNRTSFSQAESISRRFEASGERLSGLVLNKHRRQFPWEVSS